MTSMRFVALLALLAPPLLSAQTIDSLNKTQVPKSGRLAILGNGFGTYSAGDRVTIGGKQAWVTTWTDTRIVAFVHEQTPAGNQPVVVQTDQGVSNTVNVKVTFRVLGPGRLAWRFEADDTYIMTRPVVAQDGTVYAKGIDGHTYSLRPDGALNWVFNDGQTAPGDMSLMPDGTIVIGGANAVMALWPNGTLRWSRFGLGSEFLAGPTVGPDARVYAATNPMYGGLGAIILDQNGQLVSVTALRDNVTASTYPTRVEFDAQHWYFCLAMPRTGSGAPELHAMTYSGQIDWKVSGQHQALVLANGNIYVQRANNGNFYGAYNPAGILQWAHSFNALGVPQFFPNKGPDASVYQVYGQGNLVRFGPNGAIVYQRFLGGSLRHPTVTPDNQQVILNQTVQLTEPREIVSFSQAGDVLWRFLLPYEGEVAISPMSPMAFNKNATVLYQGMSWNSYDPDPHTYLYAVRTEINLPTSAQIDR